MTADPAEGASGGDRPWARVRERLHERGLRWTPQRRLLIDVLSRAEGHVTGAELLERCRALDPSTIPSTVYRTLDVLEELGLLSHSHGVDGREEFHVLPDGEHGHLLCRDCGGRWEIGAEDAQAFVASLRARRAFLVDLSHLTVVGTCAGCGEQEATGRAVRRRSDARLGGDALAQGASRIGD